MTPLEVTALAARWRGEAACEVEDRTPLRELALGVVEDRDRGRGRRPRTAGGHGFKKASAGVCSSATLLR